jgi:ABC-type multidrug transport system ATPase subunit
MFYPSLDMCDHYRAGKTTLIHLLTGMLQPSSGTATINGLDVGTQMGQIRGNLGM